MPLCPQCGQDNPAIAKFCLACATPLVAEPAPSEERRLVTAVFTDIVGSTATAEQLDPEDVRARLSPYYARVRTELERFGGTVEKFIGDAVVALFGAPVAHEDDPERAVRAALAVHDAIVELNADDEWLDLHVRTGINTGEALVVLGARPQEGEGMAAGDVMNTAARIQSGAPVDGIVVDVLTQRATTHAIDYRDAEPVQAKGKAEPIPVWQAVAVKDVPTRRPLSRAPLVGREDDLGRIDDLWADVQAIGRPGVATLLGPPGIGKSRLLAEFTDRAQRTGAVHWGRCLSYGEGITYWPVIEILKGAAGILQSDDQTAVSTKLGGLLESLGTRDQDELRTMAAALANLIGTPMTPLGTYSAAQIGQAELHWGIRRVFHLLARPQPLVLVFEDLHWAEPTLLELLLFLAEADESPILILGSARPELRDAQPPLLLEGDRRRVIELEALSGAESERLVAEVLGSSELPAESVELLLRNAGGNPLFLEETVRMLSEAGTAGADVESLPVPTSLQALIASRLDALGGREKHVAQHASVVGSVFWPGAVAALAERNGDLTQSLGELERRDLVHARDVSTIAGEREYAFKHILIRDVAYGQLPKGRRTELHVRFTDWVSALPGPEDEFVEIVAYHLEQACRLAGEVARTPVPPPVAAAVAALARAGEKAERREGTREADRYYARALELVGPEQADAAVDLRLRRARILIALGDLRTAGLQLADVAEEARAIGRKDLQASALLALASIDWKQGRAAESGDHLTEAQAIIAEVGDRQLEIRAAYQEANNRGWFEGSSDAVVEDLRGALRLAEEIEDRALRIEGHMRLGSFLFNMGSIEPAARELTAAVELAGEMGSFRDEARAMSMLAMATYYLGEIDEAERIAIQALEWLERTCDSYLQVQNLRELARSALTRGQPEVAEQRLREALPIALEGGGWLVIETYRYLVQALVHQGRLDDARALVAFAARNVPEEDAYARAALLVAEGIVASNDGEEAAAATAFSEALRLLDQQHLCVDLAETRVLLGRALRSFGDVTGARTELERARGLSARMGARTLIDEIDRELAAIAERAGSAGPLVS